MHRQIYYKPSGAVGSGAIVNMALLGIAGVLGLGALYGFAIHYVTFVYLNFFITLAYGGLVGLLVGWGGKMGKVRNPGLLAIFGVAFGLLAVYTGWVAWIYANSGRQLFLYTPAEILTFIRGILRTGSWSISDWTPTGGWLIAIWGAEAFLIIFAAAAAAWGYLASKPFCEPCNLWVETREPLSPRAPVQDPQAMKKSLEKGDFTPLRNLPKDQYGAEASTKIELLHCPNCHQTNFLTVKAVNFTKRSNNTEKEETTTIVENLIITHSTYQTLKQDG
jgi:phage FluMu protein Com